MGELFRREAVQAQQQLWLGRIHVVRPLALSWLAALATLTALVIGAFIGLAHYTRRAELPGVLVDQGPSALAVLFAPGRVLEFMERGREVRIRFDAYPHAGSGARVGHVVAVSMVPLTATEWLSLSGQPPPEPGGEARFRVDVALGPAQVGAPTLPLAPGMRLHADVPLERRRLIEWLFAPRFRPKAPA